MMRTRPVRQKRVVVVTRNKISFLNRRDRIEMNYVQSQSHLSIILLFFAFKILMSCLLNSQQ